MCFLLLLLGIVCSRIASDESPETIQHTCKTDCQILLQEFSRMEESQWQAHSQDREVLN